MRNLFCCRIPTVAAVLLACDRRDLGTAIGDSRGTGESRPSAGPHGAPAGWSGDLDGEERFEPTVFLHETVPGGTGFAPLGGAIFLRPPARRPPLRRRELGAGAGLRGFMASLLVSLGPFAGGIPAVYPSSNCRRASTTSRSMRFWASRSTGTHGSSLGRACHV